MAYKDQYRKYDWVEVELVKNTSDFRPETYRPLSLESEFKNVGHISSKPNWNKQKRYVLQNVNSDIGKLIQEAKNNKICTSLAVFKPTKVTDFIIEETSREWKKRKLEKLKQLNLFEKTPRGLQVVRKLPFKFSYRIEDSNGITSKMMIEDWEIGQLYWNCLLKYASEKIACEKVREKYWNNFVLKRDLHLFLGTTLRNHLRAPNPFIIIGTFTLAIDKQLKIFPY